MNEPKIGNRIRRLRFDNNEMTQEELADSIGVTRQTIIALEANKYVPSLNLAYKLALFFKVKIEDVFQVVDD
jgi:putative transcriptional regulator